MRVMDPDGCPIRQPTCASVRSGDPDPRLQLTAGERWQFASVVVEAVKVRKRSPLRKREGVAGICFHVRCASPPRQGWQSKTCGVF